MDVRLRNMLPGSPIRSTLAIAAALLSIAAAPAYADTVSLHSQGDDPRAITADYTTPADTITGTVSDLALSVTVTPNGGSPITIGFNPGTKLALGTTQADGAALEIAGVAGTCTSPTATVTLNAVVNTLPGTAKVLRLTFDQTCQGATGPLHGQVDIEQPYGEERVPGGANGRFAVGAGSTYAATYPARAQGVSWAGLRLFHDGSSTTLNPVFTDAYPGGVDAGRLAYQLADYRNGTVNSNVHLLDLSTMTDIPLPGVNTSRWEWNVDVSGNHLLFNRYLDARFTRSEIRLYDLMTHASTRLALGSTARGRLLRADAVAGDYVAWESCVGARCDITRYTASTRARRTLRATASITYYDPAVLPDGTVYAVRAASGCGRHVAIVRWRPGTPPVTIHAFPNHVWVANTDSDTVAGTTYLYYAHITCAARRGKAATVYTARYPVAVPAP